MAKFSKNIWTAKKFKALVEKDEVRFDNPVQRGLVWNISQKSKLIDSVIKDFPIGQVFLIEKNEYTDTIDGQQRVTTIIDFMNNKFKLSNSYTAVLNNGDVESLSKKTFNQLPKELQDRIADFNIDIVNITDVTPEEEKEIFDRLNSGKSLTNIERTKAQTKSLVELENIADHSVFNLIMGENSKNKSTHIGYAMQSYAILFNDVKCLLDSKIKQTLKNKTISQEEQSRLSQIFSLYEKMFCKLDPKSKAASKMKKKIHFVSILPAASYSIENNIEDEKFIEWIKIFFSSEDGATISPDYNNNLGGGTNSPSSVTSRVEAVLNSFKSYINGNMELSFNDQMSL